VPMLISIMQGRLFRSRQDVANDGAGLSVANGVSPSWRPATSMGMNATGGLTATPSLVPDGSVTAVVRNLVAMGFTDVCASASIHRDDFVHGEACG
jgi:hypothetical protein